jgi:hypothetical protein
VGADFNVRFSFRRRLPSCAAMAKAGRSTPSTLTEFKPGSLIGTPGFVRVGQSSAGQWWFLDGRDRPFFSCGVAGVDGIPLSDAAVGNSRHSHSGGALELERLRTWHCNTLGPSSAPEVSATGMFWMETVGFRHSQPSESTIKLGGALLPDVFDPRWAGACDVRAAEICAKHRENRELLGYFTDLGLQWAQPRVGAGSRRRDRPSLLQICLSLEPSFPAYHAAWEFVLAPHAGELTALAESWEIAPNKEALRQLTLADTPLSNAAYRRDHERFTREFAHRYFNTCAAAIRRHDPNHLVLGCTFAMPPGEAVLAASVAPAIDVLAVRGAEVDLYATVENAARITGLPVLLVEFSWANEAFRKRPAHERRTLTSIERMLANGRGALTRAFAHPALVGYIWSHWRDEADDAPPFGHGLVHVDGREAREHTELLTELNSRAEVLRLAAVQPTPALA